MTAQSDDVERPEDGRTFTVGAARQVDVPDRAALLDICERALSTPQSAWRDRDSASATRQLGEAYALLKAGCEFYITERDTRLNTWWVTIEYRGFDYFEGTFDGMGPLDHERFYIPFAERLVDGEDWY